MSQGGKIYTHIPGRFFLLPYKPGRHICTYLPIGVTPPSPDDPNPLNLCIYYFIDWVKNSSKNVFFGE